MSKPTKRNLSWSVTTKFGRITVTTLSDKPGKVWLRNAAGEGMETSAAKLGRHLEAYFRREF